DAVIFEQQEKPGGVLRYGVPEFRLNPEFLDREIQDIEKLGVKFELNSRIEASGVDKLLEDFDAVFIAPGIWKPVEQDLPGKELENVTNATRFLELARKGDRERIRQMVEGKNVAVTGGGSVAMDVATTAKAFGANKVYIIYRRSVEQMPASIDDLEMARDNFVIIKPQAVVTELIGENGKLTALKGIETDWVEPNNFTSANLKQVPGTEFNLNVSAFVMALGSKAEPEVQGLTNSIKFKDNGLIETGEDGVSTENKRILAGGDIVRGSGTVVEAVADGKEAARILLKTLGSQK
ncbi:FAD-dependent oxidoreductase, partial [Candidatus Riflebacteria bacterium]